MSLRTPSWNLLRSVLCALLMLVMGVAPLIVQAGELHAIEHAGEPSSHFQGHHDEAPTLPPDGSGDDPWHAVAHASHCCGHIVAVLPAPIALDLHALPTSLATTIRRSAERRIAVLPFRPPITI